MTLTALLLGLFASIVLLWAPAAWIACAIFAWFLAREKCYGGVSWLLLGILFGPVTLVAAVGLPDRAGQLTASPGHRKLEPTMRS